MSDDGTKIVEAVLFDAQVDGPRYCAVGQQLCELLAAEGIDERELIPFLGFYLAHVMYTHLNCDPEMFRANMREFAKFATGMFRKMVEIDNEPGDESEQIRH